MQFMRLAIIFAFFALSIARAACIDFEIFANQTSLGCNAVVNINTIYGDSLILSISPINGDIKWKATDIVVIGIGPTYTPIITESGKKITYFVEKSGVSKTINISVQARPSYTVSFDTDGGTPLSISPQIVLKDNLAKKPTEIPTKIGYDFDNWDFNFSTPITKDTTIKAKWKIKTLTVLFNSDGGSPVASQNVYYNSTASIPKPAPTKIGYEFDRWDFDFSTPITANITIKAKWKERQYTIGLFVKGRIEFDTSGFDLDTTELRSSTQRRYFVASTNLCEIKSTKIQITLDEPDIVLKINNIPQKSDNDDRSQYKISFSFGKPGLDTLIYELSKDGLQSEFDTILVETPIPFDSIVKQKWNNVLFVNNNKGEFVDFKWFKNNKEISNLQFYSAGPNSRDILNPNDIYKVTMHKKDGLRISTCEGNAKIVSPPLPPTPKLTKQVLGIREKNLKSGSKVYNLNGKLTKETAAGVYIVKE